MSGCYETYYTNEGPKLCRDGKCPSCRIFELEELLREVLSEVPHGWGESFAESDLASRIRETLE